MPSNANAARDVTLGAVAGVVAWIAGYVLTYAATSGRIQENLLRQFAEIPTWTVVGWVFYNAHAVPTVFEGLLGGRESFLGGDGGFTVALYALPVLLLLAAGVVAGRAADVEGADAANAALAGASVVLGYGLLSVAGAFVFGTETATPDLVLSLALPTLLYPLLLGGIGGALAREL